MLQPSPDHHAVQELLQRHWVKPQIALPFSKPSSEETEKLVRAAYDVLMTRQFRVGPLPETWVEAEIKHRLRYFISEAKPITITIGYAPLKNQNAVQYSRADWAEFFALGHLAAWHNKVQKVYPPGLQIQIVFDDATLSMANHVKRSTMRSYMASIRQLITVMGYGDLFRKPFAQSRFAWLFYFGIYQCAAWRVRRWERDPAHADQIHKMDEAALRNLEQIEGESLQKRERRAQRASRRYRIYWEALQLVGFSRSRKRLIAMYLDGAQHHQKQQVALHLTTLDKGQVTQPWQGEGALLDNGHGKWEPAVLTANRRLKVTTQRVDNLKLLAMPGFESITLAQSLTVPAVAPPTPSSHDQRILVPS